MGFNRLDLRLCAARYCGVNVRYCKGTARYCGVLKDAVIMLCVCVLRFLRIAITHIYRMFVRLALSDYVAGHFACSLAMLLSFQLFNERRQDSLPGPVRRLRKRTRRT
jgi:hypothetical protein